MEKIIVASNNKGKIREIKEILGGRFEIVSLSECGINIEIDETGNTFFENAFIKAKAINEITNSLVLSDDSGLCVEALDNAPGVFSARFAGLDCNDVNNNDKILRELENIENRKAKFVSCVILMRNETHYLIGDGEAEGEILKQCDGNNGFGYDPIFYSYELKKSFGKADEYEKNCISHRKKALEDVVKKLDKNKL